MALGDVEEFPSSIRAAPILQSLGVPAPLRSLTLRSAAEDYRRVAHLLPARRPSPLRRPSSAPPAAPAPMTAEELLGRFGSLNTHRSVKAGSPSRHQPLALLWAISRVVADEPRLAPWSQFRTEVGPLLAEFGLPSSKVTPEYPFWHLRRSGLWEVHGALDDAGAMPQIKVFDSVQPVAGLTCEAAELLRDPVTRLDAITKLCSAACISKVLTSTRFSTEWASPDTRPLRVSSTVPRTAPAKRSALLSGRLGRQRGRSQPPFAQSATWRW